MRKIICIAIAVNIIVAGCWLLYGKSVLLSGRQFYISVKLINILWVIGKHGCSVTAMLDNFSNQFLQLNHVLFHIEKHLV
ncbi:hypothetical protein D3C73_1387430 [compost metagenome]